MVYFLLLASLIFLSVYINTIEDKFLRDEKRKIIWNVYSVSSDWIDIPPPWSFWLGLTINKAEIWNSNWWLLSKEVYCDNMLKCFDQVIDGLSNSQTLWRNWEKVVFNESHCLVQLKVNWPRTFRQILCLVLVFFLVYPRNLASMVLVKFLFWWFDWGKYKLFLYQYV